MVIPVTVGEIDYLKRVWDDIKTLHAWFNGVKTRWNPAFHPNLINFFRPEKGIG